MMLTGYDPSTFDLMGLFALVLPFVALLINQSHWGSRTKGAVVSVLTVLAGTASVVLGGGDLADLSVTIPAILIASQAIYHQFLKPTGIAPWLEHLTDVAALFGRKSVEKGDVSTER